MVTARHIALGVVLVLGFIFASQAADEPFPTRRITLIVPFGSGGATDQIGRLLAQKMSAGLNQPVVVENRPGAGGSIGSLEVARAQANGYTLLLGTSSTHGINPWIYKLPYSVIKDFSPVSMLATTEYAVSINPKIHPTINSIQQLTQLARSRQITYGSAGNGTTSHLGGALYTKLSETNFVHVPYKTPASVLTDLLGGQVDFTVDNVSTVLPHIKTGKLRALATTGKTRESVLAGTPTMQESGVPGYELVGWFVLLAPTGTPEAVINRLNAEAVKALNQPDMREKLLADGNKPMPSTPNEAKSYLDAQLSQFKLAVDAADAKIE